MASPLKGRWGYSENRPCFLSLCSPSNFPSIGSYLEREGDEMSPQFAKKSFTERVRDTGYLLRNSFKIIGKNSDTLKPTVNMIIVAIILNTIFFGSLLSFLTGRYIGWGILALVVLLFLLTPAKIFYNIRQKANLSWLVYNSITGSAISYQDAHKHTKLQKPDLRKIALAEVGLKYLGTQRSKEGGIGSVLMNLFMGALIEIWDLLSHYMLPGVVVEQKPIDKLVDEIKTLRNNVPATLMGVFGIDFVGHLVKLVLLPFYLVIVALSVGVGYLLTSVIPSTVWTVEGFSFSWVPLFVGLFMVSIIASIVSKLVESTKVIYFTIFYSCITRPENIIEEMRMELTQFLRMEEAKAEV